MTEVQQILLAIADALHAGQLGEEGCADLAKALNGVPAGFHMDALKALLGMQAPGNE